jgi:hypothetical protein
MQRRVPSLKAILILALAAVGCAGTGTAPGHAARLPTELDSVHLGMPLADFQQRHDTGAMEVDDSMGFRISYTRRFQGGPIEYVVHEFDAEGTRPLYELIVRYRDGHDVTAIAAEKYGPPNAEGGEWRFPTAEGFDVRIWTFQNKLVIVGTLPGTEFGDE